MIYYIKVEFVIGCSFFKTKKGLVMHPSEKQFANLLTRQGRKWQYPVQSFKLSTSSYKPDFFLPEEKLYVEIIGTRQAYHRNKGKIEEFKRVYPQIQLIVLSPDGSPYPKKKNDLKHLNSKIADSSKNKFIWKTREISQYLRIHPHTIRQLAAREKIPAFKTGGQWRFDVEMINAWIQKNE